MRDATSGVFIATMAVLVFFTGQAQARQATIVSMEYFSAIEPDTFRHPHQPRYAIRVLFEAEQPMTSFLGGSLTVADSDQGRSLLAHKPTTGNLYRGLSEDRTRAMLHFSLDVPEPGENGFREVAGIVTYVTSTGTRDVDLGMMEIAAGAEAENYRIIELSKSWDDKDIIRFSGPLPRGGVESVLLFDESGEQLKSSLTGRSWRGDMLLWLEVSVDEKPPSKARVVFRLHDNIETHEVPFTITDVDLLGRPRTVEEKTD